MLSNGLKIASSSADVTHKFVFLCFHEVFAGRQTLLLRRTCRPAELCNEGLFRAFPLPRAVLRTKTTPICRAPKPCSLAVAHLFSACTFCLPLICIYPPLFASYLPWALLAFLYISLNAAILPALWSMQPSILGRAHLAPIPPLALHRSSTFTEASYSCAAFSYGSALRFTYCAHGRAYS